MQLYILWAVYVSLTLAVGTQVVLGVGCHALWCCPVWVGLLVAQ